MTVNTLLIASAFVLVAIVQFAPCPTALAIPMDVIAICFSGIALIRLHRSGWTA